MPFTEPAGIAGGTGVVRDGDWVYVYGADTAAQTTNSQYVARVSLDRITTGPWQFWSGGGVGRAVRPSYR